MMNEKTENITFGDNIRAMNDDQLADLYVALTETTIEVVLLKHGIVYDKANLDKEKLKRRALDMLKRQHPNREKRKKSGIFRS